jgi:hypothetical protein
MDCYIYANIRSDTGEIFYVGKGSGRRMLRKLRRSDEWLAAAANGFTYVFLEENLTHEDAVMKEDVYIQAYRSAGHPLVNKVRGGGGAKSPTIPEELKEKLRVMYTGKKLSEDQKKAISDRMKGKTLSQEHKAKLSAALKGFKRPRSSVEASVAKRRKPVKADTGEVFPSLQDAAAWCKLKNTSTISKCLKGVVEKAGKHPATGQPITWRYAD